MKEKVQKIRDKISKMQDATMDKNGNFLSGYCQGVYDALCEIDTHLQNLFIDSLQEEPVSDIWHDASEPPIIDKTFLLIAPNGNSSLCLWGGKELHSVTIGGGHSVLCKGDIYSYIDDLLNFDNSRNFGKNLQEEPVSEDLDIFASEYVRDPDNWVDWIGPHGETDDISYIIKAIKAGAKWQKEKDAKLPKIRQKDSIEEYAYQVAYDLSNDWARETPDWKDVEIACILGAEWNKKQMMKDAVVSLV